MYKRAENQEGLVLRLRRIPRWKDPKFSLNLFFVYERVLSDEPRLPTCLKDGTGGLVL